MHELDLDPTILPGPVLARLYGSHYDALRASQIVFEKSVAAAMAETEYGGETNRIGFQEWAVSNMDAIEGWRQVPALRRTYNLLYAEVHRRWGKDQTNDQ